MSTYNTSNWASLDFTSSTPVFVDPVPEQKLSEFAERLTAHIDAMKAVLGPSISEPIREIAAPLIASAFDATEALHAALRQSERQIKELTEKVASGNYREKDMMAQRDTRRSERDVAVAHCEQLAGELVKRYEKARKPVPEWIAKLAEPAF